MTDPVDRQISNMSDTGCHVTIVESTVHLPDPVLESCNSSANSSANPV